jgi:thermitase
MRNRHVCFFVSYFALSVLMTPVTLSFAAQPADPQTRPHIDDELIVKFRSGREEYRKLMTHYGVGAKRAKVFRSLAGIELIKLPRGLSVQEAMDIYQRSTDVLYAEPNYIVRTTSTPNDTRFNEQWGLHNVGQSGGIPEADIDAVAAWDITTGNSDVIVAVIDSGVDYNHLDLSANMFRNTADCNNNGIDDDGNGFVDDCFGIDTVNNDSDPMDDNNHGTHVAGIIGAVGNNSAGVVGINWNIKIMPCKFVNASGSGTIADAIDCLDYVKTMKDRGLNIIATSNSWGGGGFSQALLDAIEAHRQGGMLFITAAGNGNIFGIGQNNDSTPFYPCNYYIPNVICVASTTRTDARSTFSNFGSRTVHVGAPGSEILSTIRGNSYASLSGTSMATPQVTGVAALLKAQDPSWDWRTIKNLILAGGENVASMTNTIAQKRLSAFGALTCSNSTVFSRLRPIGDAITGSVGTPIDLSALNIDCASPNGNIEVSVSPGGEIVTLVDDGLGSDQAAGDGVYSGEWTPPATGIYTLTFPAGDLLTINVAAPVISISPSSLDFGAVNVGGSSNRSITVRNAGGGVLTGNATANAPFTIVSGGSYSLTAGQSQTVTIRFSPTSAGNFEGNVTFSGGAGTSAMLRGIGTAVSSITPNPIDLATPPASFTITGGGFTNFGFGLSVANFTNGSGVVLAQSRASSGTSTNLTIPFPTGPISVPGPLPGLSAGTVTVKLYNQTGANSWSLVGAIPLTVSDTRPGPGVSSITPNPIDLATPPASFTITGGGFTNFGFGLSVANFYRGSSFAAQARAISGDGTTLTVPFPTNATSISGPLPGLSAGTITVKLYNQTGSNSWSLVGTIPLTVNDTRPAPGVSSITPNPIDLATPPASFTLTGNGFTNFGFGLSVANFTNSTGTVLAQARASAGSTTSLMIPFPTGPVSVPGPLPGLSAGTFIVKVYNQTGSNSWSLVGTIPLTVNDSRNTIARVPKN